MSVQRSRLRITDRGYTVLWVLLIVWYIACVALS